MISYKEAQNIIASFAHSFGVEKVQLDDAFGRVLAEDVFADRDYPPFNRAAMDGFAIRSVDLAAGIQSFKIIDTVFAGDKSDKTIAQGECFKIMTGAATPPSADVIIRREDAVEQEGSVSFVVDETKPFQNIARKGEDLKAGQIVVQKSIQCSPAIIGLLASVGKYEVLVERLPSVAIITTGDEVVAADSEVSDVQIRNSNVHVLKALLRKNGLVSSFTRHVKDERDELERVFAEALKHNLVIVSGGVSAGDADYVPQVLQTLGVTQLFHKVSIRPGKPFWCGHKNDTMVFALPGNPLSCMVTFTIFIQHYLQACFGFSVSNLFLPIYEARKQRVKLDEFFPVQILGIPSKVQPVQFNGSGDIRLGYGAQAVAVHPSGNTELQADDLVEMYML